MSDRYPGGLIRKTPPTITPPVDGEGGSASGIWTTDQVAYYEKEGLWPKPVLPRELYAWGANAAGKVGDNTTIDKSSPVQVGVETDWAQISASEEDFSLGIKNDGTLWTWGLGTSGELGHNDTISRSSPVQVGALTTWYKASAGSRNVAAIKTDGTLWAWGSGNAGRLGNNATAYVSSPIQIGSLTTWSEVAAGDAHTVAIKTDGTLWAWGVNSFWGQVGDSSGVNRSSPVQIGSLTTWSSLSAVDRHSGDRHTAAIKTDGTLWTWGAGTDGRLGHGDIISRSSPVQVGALTTWSQVSAGGFHTAAIKTDGILWIWGRGNVGRLGQNDPDISRSSPVQLGSLTWSQVSAGTGHSGAITTDGKLYTWGWGNSGRLGHGDSVTLSSPVQVGSLTTWEQVSANSGNLGIIKG